MKQQKKRKPTLKLSDIFRPGFTALCLIVLGLVTITWISMNITKKDPEIESAFAEKARLLRAAVNDDDISYRLAEGTPARVVFFSVSDTRSAAHVYYGTGDTLDEAWDEAYKRANKQIQDSGIDPVWVKADIVYESELITPTGVRAVVNETKSFRYGLAFDRSFSQAVLESAFLASDAVDVNIDGIGMGSVSAYAASIGQGVPSSLTDEMVLFQTTGWFCDEDSQVYDLNGEGYGLGRRKMTGFTASDLTEITEKAASYLINGQQSDGRFLYLYEAGTGITPDDYNMVRHAGTLWAIVEQYDVTPSEELLDLIHASADYLADHVVYMDDETAFVNDSDGLYYTLGASGMAVTALARYEAITGDKTYADLARCLGTGIIYMQNSEDGNFVHSLNTDFSVDEPYLTVYYDGEAALGLSILYGVSKDTRYLDAAEKACDYFVRMDWQMYNDHWMSYAINEITKYLPKEEYFAIGLENIFGGIDTLSQKFPQPVYLEQMMAMFEMYLRMTELGIDPGYSYDMSEFIDLLEQRVLINMTYCLFGEMAMHMYDPGFVECAFFSDWGGFDVRMDGVQHNIVGINNLAKYLSELRELGFEFVA